MLVEANGKTGGKHLHLFDVMVALFKKLECLLYRIEGI